MRLYTDDQFSVSSHTLERLCTHPSADIAALRARLSRNYPTPRHACLPTHATGYPEEGLLTSGPGCQLQNSNIHLSQRAGEQHEFRKCLLLWEDVYLPQPPFPYI